MSVPRPGAISPSLRALWSRTVRRKRLFLGLSAAGIAVALGLAVWLGYRRLEDPSYPLGARAVIVLLVLLNARLNLRQYRHAALLEAIERGAAGTRDSDGPARAGGAG